MLGVWLVVSYTVPTVLVSPCRLLVTSLVYGLSFYKLYMPGPNQGERRYDRA
jgi:hypothetical protein